MGPGLATGPIRDFPMRIQAVGSSVGVSVAGSSSDTSITLSMGCAPGMSTRNDRATACLLAQSPGIAVSHNVHAEGERLTTVDAIRSHWSADLFVSCQLTLSGNDRVSANPERVSSSLIRPFSS